MIPLRLHTSGHDYPLANPHSTEAPDTARRAGFDRWCMAVRRRAAWWWQRCLRGERPPAVPAALGWLTAHGRDGCVAPRSGSSAPCPGLTGACLGTLWSYGQTETVLAWLDWLLSVQASDGSFPDAGLVHPSLFNTGQAVRGLLTLADVSPAAETALHRACRWLASRIDPQGAFRLPQQGGSFDRWASPLVHLACLPPLLETARRIDEPAWEEAVWRAVRHVERTTDLERWNASIRILAHGIQALVDLGSTHAARRALRLPESAQRRNGSVPAELHSPWTSSAGLAQLAVVWYKLGQRDRADRAMAYLTARQRASGGFLGSWGRGAGYYPQHEAAWTARHFLEAAQAQVRAAFDDWSPGAGDRLLPADPRWQAVCNWARQLPPGARVADVGCGNGRYLRWLVDRLPRASLTGIDATASMLERLPAGVNRQAGHLLRLPVADGAFDAVYCVEALEHSLLPEQAIAELCRAVRPGGSILVIDKNRALQPLSDYQPWERWFTREEVSQWLARACDTIDVAALDSPLGTMRQPLFFAWSAQRRSAACRMAA